MRKDAASDPHDVITSMSCGRPPRTTSDTSLNTERRSSDSAIVWRRPRRLSIRSRRSVSRSTIAVCSKATPSRSTTLSSSVWWSGENAFSSEDATQTAPYIRVPCRAAHRIRERSSGESAEMAMLAPSMRRPVIDTSPSRETTYSTHDSARSSRSTCNRSNGIASRSASASRETRSRRFGASATSRATAVSTADESTTDMGIETHQYNRPSDAGSVSRVVVYRSGIPRPPPRDRERARAVRRGRRYRRSRSDHESAYARARAAAARDSVERRAARPAHAHPSRSRRGDGNNCPRAPAHLGVRARTRRPAHGGSAKADRQCYATVRRQHEPAVGRDRAGAAGEPDTAERWRARRSRWADVRGGLHARTCITPRQLLRSCERRGICRRYRRRLHRRRLRAAADTTAGYRRREVAGEPRHNRSLVAGHDLPHALRADRPRAAASRDTVGQPAGNGAVGSPHTGRARFG